MSNYNSQLQSNNTDLQAVLQTLRNKAAGGEQATPEISVDRFGLITATAGAKTSTYQLAFQSAKTVLPSKNLQIAVSGGHFTGGNIMVAGDSNLKAENIKSGVSIFGVSGTLEEGGMSSGEQVEWSANEDAMVTDTLSSYFNDRVTTIRNYAFTSCSSLTAVSFPAATTIGVNAFNGCTSLTTASFPVAITIGGGAFHNCDKLTTVSFPAAITIGGGDVFRKCSNLTTVSFPVATTIGNNAFYSCHNLITASFPAATTIRNYAFSGCYNLKSLYLTGSSLCKLSNSNAFTSTPIGGYSASAGTYGSIYVPASLLTSYQTATNWTYFSSRFVAYNPIITFTIDGTSYQAEEGMTWAEWVKSEYAINESNNHFYINAQNEVITTSGTTKINGVSASDNIIKGTNYISTVIEGGW